MPTGDATERLIAALCELHNAEIEFIVSGMRDFKERNPDASMEEVAARGPEIEEELQQFKGSILEIIEVEMNRRRKENVDKLPKPQLSAWYPNFLMNWSNKVKIQVLAAVALIIAASLVLNGEAITLAIVVNLVVWGLLGVGLWRLGKFLLARRQM